MDLKKHEAQLEKERLRLLAIENARTPMDRLAEYRTALFNGRRDRFPDNTIDRNSHFLFFVNTPMTWTKASVISRGVSLTSSIDVSLRRAISSAKLIVEACPPTSSLSERAYNA